MYSVQSYKCVSYSIIMCSFQKIKYVNLLRLFSVVLYACLNETTLPLVSWAWVACGISYTKKNHYNFSSLSCEKSQPYFYAMATLIMRCYVTILAEIYGDPIFFRMRSWPVLSIGRNPIQVLLIQSDPARVLSIRSDPILSDPGFCGLNCEYLDRAKLSKLKCLQLQTNKYLSQFLKWLVLMFSMIDSLICEYTDPMNIVCQSCFKLPD